MASTSALVAMAVRGVFSSWLALVMNCFWASMFFRYGRMARRDKRTSRTNTTTRQTPAMMSVVQSRECIRCSSRSELRKMTTVSWSVVWTR